MKRGILFLAGDFSHFPENFRFLDTDFVIAADGGFKHLIALRRNPDMLLGDFDSLSTEYRELANQRGIHQAEWPVEKDQTDGEIAIRTAVANGCSEVILFGCWGGERVDHSIGNLMLLDLCRELGLHGVLHHQGENIMLCTPGVYRIKGRLGEMVSLITKSNETCRISTKGLKYVLQNGNLQKGSSMGISNQFSNDQAVIHIDQGEAWLIWQGELPDFVHHEFVR
jgi:thiamine pyrophosphokinase